MRAMTPNQKAWLWLGALALTMGALIFGAAGDLRFWQGWAFLAVFFAASALVTQYLIANDPALLARRVKGGPTQETEPAQKLIMVFMSFGFVALIVVPGLDHRFGWSQAPAIVALAGDVLVVAGFYAVYLVFKANSFASSTVGVAEGQTLVSTGPYAIVRHPMYAGALVYLVGTPLALGSCWGLAVLALMTPILIWRLVDEERVLEQRLPGYPEYKRKVRYRLAPRVY
jgi:protein-S-isoprenylcysteine O-methyltransferase Ste14